MYKILCKAFFRSKEKGTLFSEFYISENRVPTPGYN
jgi:hypothetical protein